MGILDGLAGQIMGGGAASLFGSALGGDTSRPLGALVAGLTGGNASQGQALLGAALSLLQQEGGLPQAIGRLQQGGLASEVASWVGTGPNAAVSGEQLTSAFGGAALGRVASQFGLSEGQAGGALAQLLPEVINQLTPQGRVSDDHSDLISQGLALLNRMGGA